MIHGVAGWSSLRSRFARTLDSNGLSSRVDIRAVIWTCQCRQRWPSLPGGQLALLPGACAGHHHVLRSHRRFFEAGPVCFRGVGRWLERLGFWWQWRHEGSPAIRCAQSGWPLRGRGAVLEELHDASAAGGSAGSAHLRNCSLPKQGSPSVEWENGFLLFRCTTTTPPQTLGFRTALA